MVVLWQRGGAGATRRRVGRNALDLGPTGSIWAWAVGWFTPLAPLELVEEGSGRDVATSDRHPPMAVGEALQVVVLLPLSGSNPPTSSNCPTHIGICYMGASSRMLGWRPRKVDYTGGSTAGDVAVLMAVSWSHAGGEEWSSKAPGVGGVSAWLVPRLRGRSSSRSC